MRILHLDPDDMDNPISGGGPVRTWEICRRLARRHEVTVLTPTFPGSTPELWRDGIRYVRLGRKVRDHGSSHHLTFLASLPWAVRRYPHDLLVEDFMPPCSATLTPLFRRRDRPMVGSVQWFSAREYTRWLKLPFHWGEEYGVRMYQNLVVLTPSMQAFMEERHASVQARVIPNGVDDALFEQPIRAGRGILFMGRIEVGAKGVDLLLQAWARLPEGEREPLTLAGKVQEPEALQRELERTGLVGKVRIYGVYNAEQRLALLDECRCLAMPSRYETFGMTISEANAAGKPVVLWNKQPMSEVAAPGCPLVPPFDVDAYAAALRDVQHWSDDDLVARGHAMRAHARRYNWDSAAAAQEAFYEELLAASPHGRRLASR